MKLGDLIKDYRSSHGLSQRQFALQCGLSNGYISILEKGVNPNTDKPVTPTIPQLRKLAGGMGLTVTELLERVDDMPIDLANTMNLFDANTPPAATGNVNILRLAGRDGSYLERTLSDDQVKMLTMLLDQMPDASDDL